MECPACLQVLPKKYWRPSQWICGAVTEHFSQCKVCDGLLAAPYWLAAPAASPPPATAPVAAPAPDTVPTVRSMPSTPNVPTEALELIELLTHFKADTCTVFVYKWMELPRALRKEYSYSGAIRCRCDTDPQHYRCPRKKDCYFDPTNWVYALTMRLMMPNLMKEVDWNMETIGDIFESILGLHYMVDNGLKRVSMCTATHIGTVSDILEEFVWWTWRLCEAIDDTDRVLVWVTWIIDMVADRQRKDDHVNHTVVYHEPRDEFDLQPRCKRLGNLIRPKSSDRQAVI